MADGEWLMADAQWSMVNGRGSVIRPPLSMSHQR
jgi:hypothetical protein